MTTRCSSVFFFITAVAILSFLSGVTPQAKDAYKSAMDVAKDVCHMSEREFRNYVSAAEKFKLQLYEHLSKCPTKCHKELYKKALAIQFKFNKLTLAAKGFLVQILGYAIEEMDEKVLKIQSVRRDFDILRVDKNSCEGLLHAFPELKKLGNC
ncbi:unnamed protein product [Cylicocyclus nassatus]|uniref:Uncharacterized protein n=1 Tax=Cylicocyclus nassatus TaxID=53992 RepID=A0AA36DMH3_CYLNA|nr:unnamed protein product [Cylicocyclus nassatus]